MSVTGMDQSGVQTTWPSALASPYSGVAYNQPDPITGTLTNGVTWTVYNTGPAVSKDVRNGWIADTRPATTSGTYYNYRGANGVQVWLFSAPVNLKFSLGGFDSSGTGAAEEGVTLPIGTQCSGPMPDSGNIIVQTNRDNSVTIQLVSGYVYDDTNGVGDEIIGCTLNNVTQLVLDSTGNNPATGINLGPSLSHGLTSLTATPSMMTAAFSGLPPSLAPGQTAQGTLTCTNSGTSSTDPVTGNSIPAPDVDDAICVPGDIIGSAISNIQCTPSSAATPSAITLHQGDAIVCTFDITAPATGPVDLQLTGDAGSAEIDTAATATNALTSPPANPALPTLENLSTPTPWAEIQARIGPTPVPAPVLSQWVLASLAMLLAAGGAVMKARSGRA